MCKAWVTPYIVNIICHFSFIYPFYILSLSMQFSDRETLLQIIDELDTFVLTPAMEPLVDKVADAMEDDAAVQAQLRKLQGDAEEDFYDAAFNQKMADTLLAEYDTFEIKENNFYGLKAGEETLLSPLV